MGLPGGGVEAVGARTRHLPRGVEADLEPLGAVEGGDLGKPVHGGPHLPDKPVTPPDGVEPRAGGGHSPPGGRRAGDDPPVGGGVPHGVPVAEAKVVEDGAGGAVAPIAVAHPERKAQGGHVARGAAGGVAVHEEEDDGLALRAEQAHLVRGPLGEAVLQDDPAVLAGGGEAGLPPLAEDGRGGGAGHLGHEDAVKQAVAVLQEAGSVYRGGRQYGVEAEATLEVEVLV